MFVLPLTLEVNLNRATFFQTTKEQLFCQWFFDVFLNNTGKWACTILGVIAFFGQPGFGLLGKFNGHRAIRQLGFQFKDELVDHLSDGLS